MSVLGRIIDEKRARARAIAGSVAAGAALVVDALAFGGDVLAALVVTLASEITLVVSASAYLARLADRVAWLPAGPASRALELVLVVAVTVLVLQLISRWRTRT